MPIIKHTVQSILTDTPPVILKETLFVGRVLKVEKVQETRNWSDTLDYSDWRTTECTWALVYLGDNAVPPVLGGARVTTQADYQTGKHSWLKPRDLTAGEKFAWIDCTNLFSDRNSYSLVATEDTFGDVMLHCGAEVYDKLMAWEAFHKEETAKRLEEHKARASVRAAEETARQAKVAERQAKKLAKEATLKAEAEKMLARIPAKGTTVTVDGFTGKIFWTGVSKYYGKFTARAGVRDNSGSIQWVPAYKF